MTREATQTPTAARESGLSLCLSERVGLAVHCAEFAGASISQQETETMTTKTTHTWRKSFGCFTDLDYDEIEAVFAEFGKVNPRRAYLTQGTEPPKV